MTATLYAQAWHTVTMVALRSDVDGSVHWDTADSSTRAHAFGIASRAGRVDDLFTDAGALVYADPAAVLAAIPSARSTEARAAAAVYRASAHQHAALMPGRRRHMLVLDALRLGHHRLAAALRGATAGQRWDARAATGWGLSERQLRVIRVANGTAWTSVVVLQAANRPVAVVAGVDGTVRRFDLATGRQVGPPLHVPGQRYVDAVASAQLDDGTDIVVGADDSYAHCWNALTGVLVRTIALRQPSIGRAAIATTVVDGRAVLLGGTNRVTVWDLNDGRRLADSVPFEVDHLIHRLAVTVLAGVPTAVVVRGNSDVHLWPIGGDAPFSPALRAADHGSRVVDIAVRGATLVTAYGNGIMIDWDLDRRTELGRWHAGGRANAVAIIQGPGAPIVAAGWSSLTLRQQATEAGSLNGHTARVRQIVSTTLDGEPVAVSAADDGTVRIWSLRASEEPARGTFDPPPTMDHHTGQRWTWLVPDGSHVDILTGHHDGLSRTRLGGTEPPPRRIIGGTPTILAVDDAPGWRVAFVESDGRLVRWELDDDVVVGTPHQLASWRHGATTVAWQGRPALLYSYTESGWQHARVVDTDGIETLSLRIDEEVGRQFGRMPALCQFIPYGSGRVVGRCESGVVTAWSLRDGSLIRRPTAVQAQDMCLARIGARDALLIPRTDEQSEVLLWDIDNWREIGRIAMPALIACVAAGVLWGSPVAVISTVDARLHVVDLTSRRTLDTVVLPAVADQLLARPDALIANIGTDVAEFAFPGLEPFGRA